mgnify:FL=1|jgi:hypothetical protein|tara:strand:- start:54 stop:383 length:330 start_codon:yes stop_codon:yes gene_type:complete
MKNYPILIIIVVGFILYQKGLFPFSGNKYQGYKCNYQAAMFGTDEETTKILKEFNGDPCMKEGDNRFKTYWSTKFKQLSVCQIWLRSKKHDSNIYFVGCDKKKPWWKFW